MRDKNHFGATLELREKNIQERIQQFKFIIVIIYIYLEIVK